MRNLLERFTWKRALIAILSLLLAAVITWGIFSVIYMIIPAVRSSVSAIEKQIPIPVYVVPEHSR